MSAHVLLNLLNELRKRVQGGLCVYAVSTKISCASQNISMEKDQNC